MRKQVSLLLDEELVTKAKQLGLNVSRTVENLLGEYLKQIEKARQGMEKRER